MNNISLKDIAKSFLKFDWGYSSSSDINEWKNGESEKRKVKKLVQTYLSKNPTHSKLIETLSDKIQEMKFSVLPFNSKIWTDKNFDQISINESLLKESKVKLNEAGVNVWYFYKKANKNKNKFFKMLSDFRKKHSDTKWIKMLDYALKDFNENPKKYKTIDDKQNKLFKNLQQNKKVYEGKLNEAKTLTLPNGVKAIIDFKGIKFKARKGAPVFLDRDELLKFFRGSTKYLRYT